MSVFKLNRDPWKMTEGDASPEVQEDQKATETEV